MFYDRVSFTTATTGTGTITVGSAESGFQTPAQALIDDGEVGDYAIVDGTAWETGRGVIGASATTMTRVLSVSSTGSLLNLSGSARCFFTPIAETMNALARNRVTATTALPGAAPVGTLEMNAVLIAGIPRLVLSDEYGIPNIADPTSITQTTYLTRPGSGSTLTNLGAVSTITGTVSHIGGTGDWWTRKLKARITGGATAGQAAGYRQNAVSEVYRIDGFRARTRFSVRTNLTGQRGFFGLSNTSAAPISGSIFSDTTISKMGVAHDTNTGNWHAITNVAGSTPTVTDLGSDFPVNATDAYDLFMTCQPNGSVNWDFRKLNLTTGGWLATASGTFSTNIPTATTGIQRTGFAHNNATASSAIFDFTEIFAAAY